MLLTVWFYCLLILLIVFVDCFWYDCVLLLHLLLIRDFVWMYDCGLLSCLSFGFPLVLGFIVLMI